MNTEPSSNSAIEAEVQFRVKSEPARALRSARAREVGSMFGCQPKSARRVEVNGACRLGPGRTVMFVGPSGSGKTLAIRELGRRLPSVHAGQLPAASTVVIDALASTLEQSARILAAVGLADARLMVNTVGELSEGQRHRLAIAMAVEKVIDSEAQLLILDEFGAVLDRLAASLLARNVRRLTERFGFCTVVATTHDDLIESLEPHEVVLVGSDGTCESVILATGGDA